MGHTDNRLTNNSHRVLAQLHTPTPALCALEHLDYAECLHRDGLKRRVAAKLLEGARRADELAGAHGGAAHGGGGGTHGGGH